MCNEGGLPPGTRADGGRLQLGAEQPERAAGCVWWAEEVLGRGGDFEGGADGPGGSGRRCTAWN